MENYMSSLNDRALEFAKPAREELLMRVKHRDDWLKLQLLVQTVLWALANGVKFQVEASKPLEVAAQMAPAVSLAFCLLYYVEDGLIHRISKYIGSVCPGTWETSTQLQNYAKGRILLFRAVAQLIAFVAVPWYLTVAHPIFTWTNVPLLLAFLIIFGGYIERRSTGS
jgi:hypothetical protein